MYIYERGIVGEAVRQKIQNTKNSIVNGAERDSTPFSAIMKSMMTNLDAPEESTSEQAVQSSSEKASLDASTLLYYLQNNEDSSVSDLFGVYKNAGMRTAATELQSKSSALLEGLTPEKLADFAEKYNALVSTLKTSGSSTSLMYLNALETYVTAELPQLNAAGLEKAGGFELTFSGMTDGTAQLASFVSGITGVTTQLAAASSSMFGSDSSYYSSLIGSML